MTTPGRAVTRLAVRQVYRGASVVMVVAAWMSAIVTVQYRTTFADALGGTALRALSENPAIRILFGPPVALDDPGGFTVWRTGTAVIVLVAVWALLTMTRLTRGDEDAGRADLLLAGTISPVQVLVRMLAVVAFCVFVIGSAVALALVAFGTYPGGAFVHGACVVGAGMVFAAIGVLSAQVMPSRPAASGLAVASVAAGLLARMIADGVDELAWLAWCTPFGLAGRAAPFAKNRIVPLAILLVMALVLVVAAVVLARHRDIGHGLVRLPASRPPRTRLLTSLIGFTIRRAIGSTAGWSTGVAAYCLLIGALITSITRFLGENRRFAELAAEAGFGGLGSAGGFAAAMFGLLTIPVGLFAASRIATTASDETTGRTTMLLALTVSRVRHSATEIVVTGVAVLVPLVVAALAFRLGAALADAPLRIDSAIAGALNAAPVVWLSLGAAVFAYGWVPRAVLAIGAVPTAGGFLFHVIAQSAQAPAWVLSISPYAHLAAVPDVPPNWAASVALTGIAVVLSALGIVGYVRRDTRDIEFMCSCG